MEGTPKDEEVKTLPPTIARASQTFPACDHIWAVSYRGMERLNSDVQGIDVGGNDSSHGLKITMQAKNCGIRLVDGVLLHGKQGNDQGSRKACLSHLLEDLWHNVEAHVHLPHARDLVSRRVVA
jgi:hypothetical protein